MPSRKPEAEEILSPAETARAVTRIATEILEENGGAGDVAIVGIHTGGVVLAGRLAAALAQLGEPPRATGAVDITLYRDDLSQIGPAPVVRDTAIDFDVSGMTVVLVDDVIFTGRTVRAAIDNLMDLGRPKRVELAVLVDRGGRELPIQPDFTGKKVSVGPDFIIDVNFGEGGDRVLAYRPAASKKKP